MTFILKTAFVDQCQTILGMMQILSGRQIRWKSHCVMGIHIFVEHMMLLVLIHRPRQTKDSCQLFCSVFRVVSLQWTDTNCEVTTRNSNKAVGCVSGT